MSLTFQQIILDAKKLVGRISDQESKADNLICEIQSVCTQIDGMKQVSKLLMYHTIIYRIEFDFQRVKHFIVNFFFLF